jgi:hypothetical protein
MESQLPKTFGSDDGAGGTNSSGAAVALDDDVCMSRRLLLFGIIAGGLGLAISGKMGQASAINPSETQITLPDDIKWTSWPGTPTHSSEMAMLYGGLDKPGQYLVLMKWYPGYMSAPHFYATDRLSLVLSGTLEGEQRR